MGHCKACKTHGKKLAFSFCWDSCPQELCGQATGPSLSVIPTVRLDSVFLSEPHSFFLSLSLTDIIRPLLFGRRHWV